MRRRLIGMVLAVALAATCLRAQQLPAATSQRGQAPTPTFRGDVAAVLVDFRVTDDEGRFVNDLTATDVQIFENGVAQRISTFSLIGIPSAPALPAGTWPGMPTPDTATNADASGRLFLIALDDVNVHPHRSGTLQELARLFITRYLGPNDQAALVATSGLAEMTREFTGNRQQLLTAVDNFVAGFGGTCDRSNQATGHGTFYCLESMATWLGAVEGRRKAIVFISEGFTSENPTSPADAGDASVSASPGFGSNAGLTSLRDPALSELTAGLLGDPSSAYFYNRLKSMSGDAIGFRAVINAAARANVSIYAIDPRGNPAAPVTNIKPVTNLAGDDLLSQRRIVSQQMLAALGPETGGFTAIGSNDFAGAFERVVQENSSYYLLGYSSSNPARDRAFRRIQIKTTRPDLRIRARSGYFAEPPATKTQALPKGWTPELLSLVTSPAPVPGLPLHVAAAAFRGENRSDVTVVVEADGVSAQPGSSEANLPVTLVVVAADGRGTIQSTAFASFSPAHAAGAPGQPVRAVSRLPLKPGSYSLRIAGTARDNSLRGSVIYDLEVPKFGKEKLEMSGVVLSSRATSTLLTSGDDRTWREEGVAPPTTRRRFALEDELTASAEVYANDSRQPRAIEIVTSVERESGERVFSAQEQLTPAAGARGKMRHRAVIPLSGMTPGNYVLTLQANGFTSVTRKIPFSIAAASE
jgi:VWFA-related protein